MPTILQLFGLKFRIYVRDHEPIHVHVIGQDGEAKFQVEGEIKLVQNHGLKPRQIKMAEIVIEENQEYIVNEWVKIYGK